MSYMHYTWSGTRSWSTQEWLILFDDLSLVKIFLNESNRETGGTAVLSPEEEDAAASTDKTSSKNSGAVGGEETPSPPTGPSLGSGSSLGLGWTSVRQTGHVEQAVSHLSTQSTWKTCLQLGSSLAVSCSSNRLRHTAHSVADATSRTVKLGREAMSVGSRPRLGVWKGWRTTTGRPRKVSLRRRRTNLA